ncbi:MAG: permease [Clostridiales bacterium]|nr:permease [Clostridiales bacterium]MCF8021486.1 permease [Clostridiales bacterium]
MVLVIIYGIVVLCLGVSLVYDRDRTMKAFKVTWMMLKRMLPPTLAIAGFIGMVMGFVPREVISHYMGNSSGLLGVFGAAAVGAVAFIPGLVAFPFAGSLLDQGASVMIAASFVTTLTMVGVVTAPLEASELGLRFTLWRNGLSFVFALILGVLVGVVL